MSLFTWANERVKHFSWLDVKLIAWAGAFLGIILVILFPVLTRISIWWYIFLCLICLIRPYSVLFSK
jgi:hypothetical protein